MVLVVSSSTFLLLAGIIIFFLLSYQRKKFGYHKELIQLRQQFDRAILQAHLEIQENTLNNVSQEIHDNVGQLLSLAKVQLNIMDESNTMDKSMLNDVKESIGNAMTDLRDIAKSLSGKRMQQMGIVQAIRQDIERINKSGVLLLRLNVTGELDKLNEQKQLILFRIVQEALQNIIKHAEATEVEIIIVSESNFFELSINDNGKGFIVEQNQFTGMGLQNIINRANLIGGEAIIMSAINEGCKVKIVVPYD